MQGFDGSLRTCTPRAFNRALVKSFRMICKRHKALFTYEMSRPLLPRILDHSVQQLKNLSDGPDAFPN